ncbi:hypothetical protein ACWKSP_01730 [Micromonosporaceae bacterium Da 78-11]
MTRQPEPSEDEMRGMLRRAAAEHQPDRTAMLNRIAQSRATEAVAGHRPRGQAFRLAGSALAVATVLGIGGVARWTLADEPGPDVPPVATAPTTTTKAPTTRPSTSRPAGSAPPSTVPGRPGDTRVEQGPVWSDGSVDPASTDTLGISRITVKAREPITALQVTVRIALTSGVLDQGATVEAAGARFDSTVVQESGALVYRFVSAPGTTLKAGTYVFFAKYAHQDGGRDAGDDTYQATARAGAQELDVYGNFYPTD